MSAHHDPNTDDDPLWLHSPVKRRLFRLGCYALFVGLCAGLFSLVLRPPWGALAGTGAALIAIATNGRWIEEWLMSRGEALRHWTYRNREGVHHSFAGVSLDIHDDGRDCWIDERSLRTLLALHTDRALKARFANQWRTGRELGLKGPGLWVRVRAVHHHLAEAPERMDPKRVRLRTYLDRDILQPAARRHARGG